MIITVLYSTVRSPFTSLRIRYEDTAMVLSAIRNLDGAEINGRKMRVSFTNTSGLKDVAKALGHDFAS